MASNNEHKIRFPFFQVKSFGKVIDHTNDEQSALKTLREAVKPAEMWEVNADGSAKLIRSVGYFFTGAKTA